MLCTVCIYIYTYISFSYILERDVRKNYYKRKETEKSENRLNEIEAVEYEMENVKQTRKN